MSLTPETLSYSNTHEWVQDMGNDVFLIGITDHVQSMLGDLMYIEMMETGTHLDQGDELGVVESVNASLELFSPLSGEIIDINELLLEHPEIINQSPYQHGWLYKIQSFDQRSRSQLMDANAYKAMLTKEAH